MTMSILPVYNNSASDGSPRHKRPTSTSKPMCLSMLLVGCSIVLLILGCLPMIRWSNTPTLYIWKLSAQQEDTSSVSLLLAENLVGSPAIGSTTVTYDGQEQQHADRSVNAEELSADEDEDEEQPETKMDLPGLVLNTIMDGAATNDLSSEDVYEDDLVDATVMK